jgi:hypothetical protein
MLAWRNVIIVFVWLGLMFPLAAVASLLSAAAFAQTSLSASGESITRFTGAVDADNADNFISAVADVSGKLIAIKATVKPSTGEDSGDHSYLAEVDDGRLIVSWATSDEGWTMVVPAGGYRTEKDRFVIEGIFVPNVSGPLQGNITISLETVDETTARRNPGAMIIDKAF